MKKIINKIDLFWNKKSFSFLLIILAIYIFIVIPLVNEKMLGEIIFFIFYFLLLSSGLPFLIQNKRVSIIFILIIAPFVLLFSQTLFRAAWLSVCADGFIVLYCLSLGTIILIKTFSKTHITTHRVEGAIVVYLLLGFSFSSLFHIVYTLDGQGTFRGMENYSRTEFMYFSLTTLTTVGYGDISPINTVARSLSNLESLIGQLYPAILIARLISMEYTSSKERVNH